MSGSAPDMENVNSARLLEEIKELRAKLATSLADNEKLRLTLGQIAPQSSAFGHVPRSNDEVLRLDPLSILPFEITNLIFQHLSLADLKSCRLVNSAWRCESTRAFETSGVVRLNELQFQEFRNMMEPRLTSGDFPFARFSIAQHNAFNDDDHIPSFFATFGSTVRHLTLEKPNRPYFNPANLDEQLERILRSAPNLQQLQFQLRGFRD